MATVIKDETKENLPKNFAQSSNDETKNIGNTPWKEFFTDLNLQKLIETALVNNQELMKTYQEIEMAKSNVLYQKGKLSPFVNAGGSIGVKKSRKIHQ